MSCSQTSVVLGNNIRFRPTARKKRLSIRPASVSYWTVFHWRVYRAISCAPNNVGLHPPALSEPASLSLNPRSLTMAWSNNSICPHSGFHGLPQKKRKEKALYWIWRWRRWRYGKRRPFTPSILPFFHAFPWRHKHFHSARLNTCLLKDREESTFFK